MADQRAAALAVEAAGAAARSLAARLPDHGYQVSFPPGRDPAVLKVIGLTGGPCVEVTAEEDGQAACHYTGRSTAESALDMVTATWGGIEIEWHYQPLAALQLRDAPGTADACTLARQAETGELGTGAGWMDFLACASGGVNQISAGTRPHAALITASLGLPVVLIDTRQRHATATVLASKRERFQAREPAMLTYVTETAALVEALTAVLHSSQPDYREAGTLLSAAHALLRDQAACSTPLIEECACHLSQTSTNWQAMQRWSITGNQDGPIPLATTFSRWSHAHGN